MPKNIQTIFVEGFMFNFNDELEEKKSRTHGDMRTNGDVTSLVMSHAQNNCARALKLF